MQASKIKNEKILDTREAWREEPEADSVFRRQRFSQFL